MKQLLHVLIGALACSCGSKGAEDILSQADALVVTAGPIPAALKHTLTPDDIDRLKRHYPRTLGRIRNHQPLHMQDVINMTRAGVCDDVIIHEIRATRSSFFLTPQNEQTLEQAGVSRRVIDEMVDTAVDR